ncbi:type II secretion system protein E [Saccharophagus degradans 2-40]|uniref:Type II secretion system protein E n=1 Tax=Saccharophagus degradans (strain 2-40 / ATCC 43961 / DSM 17024) TaxID=203122 RepID=Q21EP5_SACD2|nr:type II secretion system protein E [Saccharophagus degradans 2-40]
MIDVNEANEIVEVTEQDEVVISRTRLPFSFASEHGVVIEDGCILHRSDISAPILLELRRHMGRPLILKQVDEAEFKSKLTKLYQSNDGEAQQAVDEMGAEFDLTQLADDISDDSELLSGDGDAPVIRLINAVLSQAVQEQASDIHVEPYEDRVSIRFRVDGILNEVLSPKPVLAPVLVSRLKVMARLDIAEKRIPQDGRITVKLAGHAVDIRVSTIPSAHGERVVLRLLDQAAGQLGLPQLRMPEDVQTNFEKALRKPHGIILVTGPTGSGKTTSLYAGLSYLNTRSRNILTIEDPIEYLLAGIGQTQVNTKVDMTFARGLRAILRQDPDVVMIGEIRDQETAQIAVQASLTGHLVLSTLHTNTAIGAVMRLQDMGVEPFLLSSSLEGLMAQRLVRLLCSSCKEPHEASASESQRLGVPEGSIVYRAVGCDKCHQTGYRGRTGIYELIPVDDTLRQLIHEEVGEQAMLAHARKTVRSIDQDGREKVLQGMTSVEEVLRVTALS